MPSALVYSALPSARKVIRPMLSEDFRHSSITNTSLTAMTAISSTPFALNSSARFTKGGMWLLWQVGVNAPGTAKRTTFRPPKNSDAFTCSGPSGVTFTSVPSGMDEPFSMAMMISVPVLGQQLARAFRVATRVVGAIERHS